MTKEPNYALFLDRDGVINKDKGYVHKIDDFEFNIEIFNLVRTARKYELKVIIITNQSGIGRGFYSIEDFQRINSWMLNIFEKNGASIDKVFYSPSHPTKGLGSYKIDDYDRKPSPGMILKAQEEYSLSFDKSILVGDKKTDIQAGRNAGIGHLIHINDSFKNSNLIEVQNGHHITNSLRPISSFIEKLHGNK